MNLYTINTGYFKLDGGAMFGVVPKSIWNNINPADEKNMCSWALRCLLIEDGNRLILVDNGMGNKQAVKFFSYYYLHGDDSLDKSLPNIHSEVVPDLSFRIVNGHTEAMMLPQISYKGRTIVFMADLLPSHGHLPVPYIMAYDMFPLSSLQEKKSFLNEALQNDYIL